MQYFICLMPSYVMLFSDVFRKRTKLVFGIWLDRGVLGGAVVPQVAVGCCWVLLTHSIGFEHSTASVYADRVSL